MRHLFGGSPADYAMEKVGSQLVLRPGAVGTVWDAPVEGTQYTDLTDTAMSAVTQVTADSNGAIAFYGPDNVTSLYVDFGFGRRTILTATDLGTQVTTLAGQVATLAGQTGDILPKSTVTTKGDLVVGTAAATVARLGVGTAGQELVAAPVAAGGVAWSNGWRRRALPDMSTADTVSAITAPTISVTQQSTSTIASAQALLAPDTGPFLYLGAGSFSYGTGTPDSSYYLPLSRYPNTYASGQANWSLEFCTDAAQFEIKFKYISTATKYRLSVDDRKITDLAQLTGASSAGSSHVLKVAFGSAAPRKIRFDFTTMPFGGLFLAPGATAWKPAPRGGRLGVFGDSISDGSAESTGAGIGTWTYRLGRLLGCTDVWDQSRGGTGYITAGSYATLGNRVANDITPYAFDRLIVWAGYNDNGGNQATISSAAASLYTALKSAVAPGGDIFVIGCYAPNGSPTTAITNTDTTLRTAAAGAGLPFVSPLTGTVYDAAGNAIVTQGPWITTANASSYIGSDNVHPNDSGHIYLSRRVFQALCAAMPA
ncbi:hypothetical protein GPZ77_34675 (plasmid) [Streptomyces sp. QHH-9511]|uniref:SGNH/GDSL hydrolase family protein n=1 Tax=Streptomyces sp. QHH-9511 TaxID=2684468 RepID=UPI001316F2E7|nr:SGNH/GDSL hydrolase family protein [Streptomyces sp. QHH-9511]QGZ53373.1 hypothetical protein GPZ77_34675 [Streptomyces sp. QHH-9511]